MARIIPQEQIKRQLKLAGVKNLIEFGYPHVTADNIMTVYVYGAFFKAMLKENLGQAGEAVDRAIKSLMDELDEIHEKAKDDA